MKTIVVYIVFCVILLLIFWQYTKFLKKEQIKRTAILESEQKGVEQLLDEMKLQSKMIADLALMTVKSPIEVPVKKKSFKKKTSKK